MQMSLGMYQTCNQIMEQELTQEQKLEIKQLLSCKQLLLAPEFSNATKGLEGLMVAHKILQERKAPGILIGGLAETVWNQRVKPEDLSKHKDVDVMALDDQLYVDEFEGGIDWWLPVTEKLTLRTDTSTVEGFEQTYWINGNGVTLNFGLTRQEYDEKWQIKKHFDIKPGLYIPSRDFVVEMRFQEAIANFQNSFSQDVEDEFKKKLDKRIKTCLPKFIREQFKGYILSEKYEKQPQDRSQVIVDSFDNEIVQAIINQ